VDDDETIQNSLSRYLIKSGHSVEKAHDGSKGLAMIEQNDYDLALIDMQMPGMDGMSVVSKAREIRPELPAVIITGHGSMDLAIQALRKGAADFLTKPIKFLELDAVIEKAARIRELYLKENRLRQNIARIQIKDDDRERGRRMIARSPAMKQVEERIKLAVSAICETILITGETGTGKEVVAREIHYLDPQNAQNPFIPVSCPALPETLIESELFGHTKGSFTGASADKAGVFELAEGGTLFLDEVSDLTAAAQAKLLRVLETRMVRRVGGAKEIPIKVKVIAATNKPLPSLVESGKFREDLFYRLNVFALELKPLRERKEDILPLAEHFLNSFAARRGLPPAKFSAEARELLLQYSYPGNARELRNLVESAIIVSQSDLIKPEHVILPTDAKGSKPNAASGPGKSEKELILAALEKAKWNRRLAAQELNMPYSTLRFKLQKYEIK
jgi:DNA-binding NtrC family response regulator